MNRRTFVSAGVGLALTATVPRQPHAEEKQTRGPVIVEAGRRVDAPDAGVTRFPARNVPEVRKRINQVLRKEMPVAIVSSAACGADLLLLDAAGRMHVPRYIFLPSDTEDFRKSSVTDRPGDWGEIYTNVLQGSTVEVLKLPEGQEGYLETNLKLLDQAQVQAKLKRTNVHALVIWNQESRGSDDVTAHFLEQAKRRDIPIIEVSTL
ncbi:hypothetical protein RBB77_21530 [Tunturibacter psychrotolerans]|uniref:Uncharacterized protein n=1 Tax=Tunturiibacter psychrotolerans TaxID=3069686 RepID=A0AAU7ZPX6_9BACT